MGLQEWLYLFFMTILLIWIEWFIIDYCAKRRNFPINVIVLHASAAFEVISSFLIVLKWMSQESSWFTILSCPATRMSDWYTIFWNPPNLSCTQEAVYPLFSMVLWQYALSLLLLLIVRPIILSKIKDKKAPKTIYLTLYVIPALAFLHILFCGVIFYLFPYITIVASVISLAVHMACRLDQRTSSLFITSVRDLRNVVIILGHWFLHAIGLVALTHFKNLLRDLLLLLCVPLPTIFYILTARFSDPSKIITS